MGVFNSNCRADRSHRPATAVRAGIAGVAISAAVVCGAAPAQAADQNSAGIALATVVQPADENATHTAPSGSMISGVCSSPGSIYILPLALFCIITGSAGS